MGGAEEGQQLGGNVVTSSSYSSSMGIVLLLKMVGGCEASFQQVPGCERSQSVPPQEHADATCKVNAQLV